MRRLTCDDGCRVECCRRFSTPATPGGKRDTVDGYGPSPYPEIDDFIRSRLRDDVIALGDVKTSNDDVRPCDIVPTNDVKTFDDVTAPGNVKNSGDVIASLKDVGATSTDAMSSSADRGENYRTEGGVGTIRKWSYFQEGELILYDIGNYRYCANVRRHHRSNNIMYVTLDGSIQPRFPNRGPDPKTETLGNGIVH